MQMTVNEMSVNLFKVFFMRFFSPTNKPYDLFPSDARRNHGLLQKYQVPLLVIGALME